MKNLFLLSLFCLLCNDSFAGPKPKSHAPYNGFGVPEEIETKAYASWYTDYWIKANKIKVTKNVFEFDQEKGGFFFKEPLALDLKLGEVWKVSNNNIGVGLRYTGNKESVFKHIIEDTKMPRVFDNKTYYQNGKSYVNSVIHHLKTYSKNYGCIPKVNFAGHGWASFSHHTGTPDGDGLIGFGLEKIAKLGELVSKDEIKFCNVCLVQIHSCNISTKTADSIASATGCQVVSGTGRVGTFSTKYSNHWFSDRATLEIPWRKEVFYRVTPLKRAVKNSNGDIIKYVVRDLERENLGVRYIAL